MPETQSLIVGSRRRSWLLKLLVVIISTGILWLGLVWHDGRSVAEAEESALDFICMKGFRNEGYRHTLVSSLLSWLPVKLNRGRPFASIPIFSVSFPRDRMNNDMASELLHVRHLDAIELYPSDPDGRGVDFHANVVTTVQSLRGLELALSEQSIAALEDRFPNLIIRLRDLPPADSPVDVSE